MATARLARTSIAATLTSAYDKLLPGQSILASVGKNMTAMLTRDSITIDFTLSDVGDKQEGEDRGTEMGKDDATVLKWTGRFREWSLVNGGVVNSLFLFGEDGQLFLHGRMINSAPDADSQLRVVLARGGRRSCEFLAFFSSLREHQDASTLRVGPRASTRRTVQALRAPRLPRDPIISFVVREVKLIE